MPYKPSTLIFYCIAGVAVLALLWSLMRGSVQNRVPASSASALDHQTSIPTLTNGMTSSPYSPMHDSLLEKRQVLIGTPIDDQSAQVAIAKLLYLNMQDSNSPIALYINSPGGSVTASLAIVDTIIGLGAPVHTHSIRYCQGTAVLILAAGCRGQRRAMKDTELSIEPTELGSADSQKRAHIYLERLKERMASILSTHTKFTQEQALEALNKGKHFTAQEALAEGIIDSITEADTSQQ